MFKALGAEYVLPVHHSTFRLSREPVDEPLERFMAAAGDEGWRVVGREIGATWELP
jgi:L-ascorbate metabolism protein UlaG (beta-lactamase superfamily)